MEFEVTEIKALGNNRATGFTVGPESLSLRLEGYAPCSVGGPRYTLHAVVPYSPEFGTVQVGQKFKLERVVQVLVPVIDHGRKS